MVLNGDVDGDLHIQVVNPVHGPGDPVAEPLPGAGTGLIGIGERVSLAGGRVEYAAENDRFRLQAWLPWA